jgi:death-on-curing protein
MIEMENIVVAIAEGCVDKTLLQRVVISLIEDDDFPDDLKLDLVEAMGYGEPDA